MESVIVEGDEETIPRSIRTVHWKLLSSLKTTVEGLVSTNHPNVWSKYGGLERLFRDMNNILCYGLIQDKVYCMEKSYWPFVKDVRWVSPHLAHHIEQFMHLDGSNRLKHIPESEREKAEYWLLHSLQFHSLSAQLKPLLANKQYIRKFYKDTAFLLSDAHVTAMFQCLEAVEQNNPKLLAQIDPSMFAKKCESPSLTKSQSLTSLPGSRYVPLAEGVQRRSTLAYSSLLGNPLTICCLSGDGMDTSHPRYSDVHQNQMDKVHISLFETRSCSKQPSKVPEFTVTPSAEAFSPVSETTMSSSTSPSEDLGSISQEDPQSELDDGPEYLAIGNLGRRGRSSSQSSGSIKSSNSDTLCSFSAEPKEGPQTQDKASGTLSRTPSLLSLPRRSSFSEGQNIVRQSSKKSHTRSHSDTGLASGKTEALRRITVIVEDPVEETHSYASQQKEFGCFFTQKSEASTLCSRYMETEGVNYINSPDGMFRRPSEGQSLMSYLAEQDFGSCADLEKENAHFSICESLIAAIELMKCNMMWRQLEEEEEESDKEIQELKQKIRIRRQQIRNTKLLPSYQDADSDNFTATDSGSQLSSHDSIQLSDSGSTDGVDEYELKDADIKKSLTSSSSKPFHNSESVTHFFLHSNSAEAVAMGLLKQFEGMQLPAASELDWLVPEQDAPQKLLPIPDSLPVSPDDGEHADIYKLRIRVRGNLEWAPPRPQIIFNIHPSPKRKVVVAKQNYRCAGCGIRTDPDYIKRLRYCEYVGKYFCQCCHENALSPVPSRILRKWDFSRYYISNFSKDLLNKIWNDPLFNVQDINSALYRKVKALEQVRLLRIQLVHMKNMFKTCRLAKNLLDHFDTEPGHLTEDLHLYSLNDLTAIKKGELAPRLKELVRLGAAHVEKCMLCQAKGFICEFCQNDKDIIFPFELNKCKRCEECSACYHKSCFRSKNCPRCSRLQTRRELLAKQNIDVYASEEEQATLALEEESTG
ncbi:run domain Beclin-1-interacting and cysteine-rich domain-containing protein isoform X3 [Protopterus annectens]|uniref:run domain Beclin-1-interacting and cysteine-rich domain-containing protein isoform X3 n=1 Tax=Protopterus annectens TaxID=7888 RepID=UPI001CFAAD09|nr:run domain Beclin-1-interacting and cysteine-rich domain-containing protein isoform X3 [Protopterus annectens]